MVEEYIIEIFNVIVFGNPLWKYFLFAFILLLTYPASKIIIYILKNYLIKWAERTKWKFDDVLIKSINPPITMFVFAGLFYVGMTFIEGGIVESFFQRALNFLLIIPIVYFLIKFSTEAVGVYLKEGKKKSQINEAAIDLLMQITRVSLFLIGVLLILGNLGYNISALLAGLGVGGLAFALAAQDVLKNFFAGISLIFDKAFAKGERVKFGIFSGVIEEMSLRSTKIRTYDGTLVTVPNAMLANDAVENVTKVPKVKVAMTIGVTYDTSTKKLKQAKEIILKAIKDEELADQDSTFIWFDNFGAYSLDIQVIYFGKLTMDDWPERAYFKERVNFAIKEGFEKAGIVFAFPTQTLEIPSLEKKGKK